MKDGIEWQGLGVDVQNLIKAFCGEDISCCNNKAKAWVNKHKEAEKLLNNYIDERREEFIESLIELLCEFNDTSNIDKIKKNWLKNRNRFCIADFLTQKSEAKLTQKLKT